jgi:hypothetical protein
MVPIVTTPYLPEALDRVQRDLIENERDQRRSAEKLARDLAKLLQELAIVFDGNRLETLRREDPKVPQYWGPEEWRVFFASVPDPSTKDGWGQADAQRVAELERTIAELKTRLADTERLLTKIPSPVVAITAPVLPVSQPGRHSPLPRQEVELTRAQPGTSSTAKPAPSPAPFEVPQGMTPPLGSLLARSREVWNLLPATCPAAFQSILSGKGRTGEDLKKAFQRYWLTIYLIGACQLNATLELEDLLAMTCGLTCRAGSLGRIFEDLLDGGILIGEILRIGSPRTSLRLVKFTPAGARLYKILFDRDPLESDWERLIKNQEGVRSPEHSLAVLIFAMHARKRGWATQILPSIEGTKAVPDLLVLRGSEKWYVEIEPGKKESETRWRNQSELNGGRVALCGATPATRLRLAGDCKLARLPGMATDLETLVQAKYPLITDQTPLWIESW